MAGVNPGGVGMERRPLQVGVGGGGFGFDFAEGGHNLPFVARRADGPQRVGVSETVS